MLFKFLSQIGLVLLIGACLFAWIKGGPAERVGAAMVAVAWIVGLALQAFIPKDMASAAPAVLDVALAIGLLVVAIRYSSMWLGVAMMLQSAILFLHAERLAGGIGPHNYYVGLNVTGAAMLTAIVMGAAANWRRQRRARRAARTMPPPAMATPA
jgi:hypothetical protein